MKFHVIDRENWNREQYFEHYLELKCTFSMTVNVDITLLIKKVHQKGIKFYPTFIYIISRIINKHKEFRTCFNDEGVLGYWEEMIPSYTIFHKDDKSFSSIWTDYSSDFRIFYKNYEEDMRCYASVHGLSRKKIFRLMYFRFQAYLGLVLLDLILILIMMQIFYYRL